MPLADCSLRPGTVTVYGTTATAHAHSCRLGIPRAHRTACLLPRLTYGATGSTLCCSRENGRSNESDKTTLPPLKRQDKTSDSAFGLDIGFTYCRSLEETPKAIPRRNDFCGES